LCSTWACFMSEEIPEMIDAVDISSKSQLQEKTRPAKNKLHRSFPVEALYQQKTYSTFGQDFRDVPNVFWVVRNSLSFANAFAKPGREFVCRTPSLVSRPAIHATCEGFAVGVDFLAAYDNAGSSSSEGFPRTLGPCLPIHRAF